MSAGTKHRSHRPLQRLQQRRNFRTIRAGFFSFTLILILLVGFSLLLTASIRHQGATAKAFMERRTEEIKEFHNIRQKQLKQEEQLSLQAVADQQSDDELKAAQKERSNDEDETDKEITAKQLRTINNDPDPYEEDEFAIPSVNTEETIKQSEASTEQQATTAKKALSGALQNDPRSKVSQRKSRTTRGKALTGATSATLPAPNQNMEELESRCGMLMGYDVESSYDLCQADEAVFNEENGATTTAGKLECKWNPILGTSFCEAKNIAVNPMNIQVTAGGEPVHHVMGRSEKEEFPTYSEGAFQLSQCNVNREMFSMSRLPHHLLGLMQSVQRNDDIQDSCREYVERPTLFLTRYEYANLYHTYTDWYLAYQAVLVAFDGDVSAMERVDVVFLDGHSQGALDLGWKILFPHANITFISELWGKNDVNYHPSPSCYRRAIFVPPGYNAPVSIATIQGKYTPKPSSFLSSCEGSKWHKEFRQIMIDNSQAHLETAKGWLYETFHEKQEVPEENESEAQHYHKHHHHLRHSLLPIKHRNHPHRTRANNQEHPNVVRVLFFSRRDYFAHPRMNGRVKRQIANEEELLSIMEQYSHDNNRHNSLKNVVVDTRRIVLDEHDFSEQTLMVQQADIIVGMHGAGLTHILVARPGTLLLELKIPSYSSQQHFDYLAQLSGCLYQKADFSIRPSKQDHIHHIPPDEFQAIFEKSVHAFLDNQEKIAG